LDSKEIYHVPVDFSAAHRQTLATIKAD